MYRADHKRLSAILLVPACKRLAPCRARKGGTLKADGLLIAGHRFMKLVLIYVVMRVCNFLSSVRR